MSAEKGNDYARKYKTPEQRKEVFLAFCAHVAQGFSKESFPECSFKTMQSLLADFKDELDLRALEQSMRTGRFKWEQIGMNGAMGVREIQVKKKGKTKTQKLGPFNAQSWTLNMMNRYGWRQKNDVREKSSTMNADDFENFEKNDNEIYEDEILIEGPSDISKS